MPNADSLVSPTAITCDNYLQSVPSVDQLLFAQLSDEGKAELSVEDIADMLHQTESLGEQAEIIHYLYLKK